MCPIVLMIGNLAKGASEGQRERCRLLTLKAASDALKCVLAWSGETADHGCAPGARAAKKPCQRRCTGQTSGQAAHAHVRRRTLPSGLFFIRYNTRHRVALSSRSKTDCSRAGGMKPSPPRLIGRASEGTRNKKMYDTSHSIANDSFSNPRMLARTKLLTIER